MWISWQVIVGFVVAVYAAIGTAMWGYFSLHADLRNHDGTRPTAREHWARIFGLLAYFSLGWILFGGGTYVVLQIVHAL